MADDNEVNDQLVLLAVYTIHSGIVRAIGQWKVKEEVAIKAAKEFYIYHSNSTFSTSYSSINGGITQQYVALHPIFQFEVSDQRKIIVLDFRYINMIDYQLMLGTDTAVKAKPDIMIKNKKEKE